MNKLEETKLRAVLPQHLVYTNGPEGPSIYDTTTENTTRLLSCTTAAQAIGTLIHDARAQGRTEGRVEIQFEMKKVLGVREDIVNAMHAAMR